MTAPQIRVLIVDDNKVVRRGLRLRLQHAPGIIVVGEAGSGADALAVAGAERAEVVLMDLHMPGMDGIATTRAMMQSMTPLPKVVLITSEASDAFVVDAIDAGATGYLLKSHDTDQLVQVIRGAAQGTATISSRMTPRVLLELARRRPAPANLEEVQRLSPAETRVVALLSRGVTSNEDVARALSLSVNTVRSHAATAMRKLKVADRTQLALWGIKNGLQNKQI
ncbi:response regulator transcription factor [Microbacterium sp. PRF11]|uniref:response regulator transcription factor n=1 Tax=Microbacterium sp. PRF11 TaxID=2962593 RepID=UPI002882AAE8|nr:response regulator transcription factor [Microbacterium sp. PRF11]MDT0116598.1 response regulator transcription factor [Microbacterium sp. PRF11]